MVPSYTRQKWSSQKAPVQAWVNDVIWKLLLGPEGEIPEVSLKDIPPEAADVCREVILHNRLEGQVALVYGEKLLPVLGQTFYDLLEHIKVRSDLYTQLVNWLLGPSLGIQSLLLDDFAMRRFYTSFSDTVPDARFIHTLTLWTPTLATREEVIKLLQDGGFQTERNRNEDESGTYDFAKPTPGLPHRIKLLGTIWGSTKNWNLDIERDIFNRSVQFSTSVPLRPEVTDLFLLQCRRFSIDSVAGGALRLLDLVTLLKREGDNLDWDRLRHIKNAFAKPDWFWAAMVAVGAFEAKTGRTVELPAWVRDYLKEPDSFWTDFIATRMNWAHPDARLIDFPRAYVKAAKGT